ncbi:MAG TPA: hypothetical protein VFD66_06365 [Verrucomicrobiae bacterium]|nr:hypothetical protein [Verrucomicrobiae bacterium]
MNLRLTATALLCLFAFSLGCGKSETPANAVSTPGSGLSADTIASIHWRGKKDLGIISGAYYLLRLWNLGESTTLEKQTLDKLSSAPWRWLHGEAEGTNEYHFLLRPLLDDVLREESYFEMRQPANQPGETVFAIRLDERRAGVWETNLANVLNSLAGAWPLGSADHGWTLQRQQNPKLIELVRAGDWTLIGVADAQNHLLRQVAQRVATSPDPFGTKASDHWLEAHLKLQRIHPVRANAPGGGLPMISLAVSGDGGNVLVHGTLDFPQPMPGRLGDWTFPTNRIREPMVSLAAIRGIQPWLSSCKFWTDLQPGAAPDQFYSWAPDGVLYQLYVGAPVQDAMDRVHALNRWLLETANPWLGAHATGQFEQAPDGSGAMWTGLPLIAPSVRAVDGGKFLLSALLPKVMPGTNTQAGLYEKPSLDSLLGEIMGETNLLAYHWEMTGPRIESWLFLGQTLSVAFRHGALPFECASVEWLKVIKERVGNCTTRLSRTGPNQLTFDRKSTIGLTGAELNLLADWLESPAFPRGLYSTLTPPPQPALGGKAQ